MHLWFLRHGEVEAPYVGTFVGTKDVDLSSVGEHQAEALAAFLEGAEIDAVLSSPRKRAQRTAAPIARSLDTHVETRPFAEMDFGQWEGLAWNDIEGLDPDFAAKWQEDPVTLACPGGETVQAFSDRIQSALDDLREEFAGRTVVLAAHAGTNRAILADALDVPYLRAFAFAQDYGCANAIAYEGGFAQIAITNVVPGPRSEAQGDGRPEAAEA